MQKKGQVSIFVVVGILILLILAIIVYYQNAKTIFTPQKITPAKENAVQTLVTNCVQELGTNAVLRVGQQGGYVNFPPELNSNPTTFIKEDTYGLVRVPLWYYQGEKRVPPYSYVEGQIQNYIQDNLKSCLHNFTSLENEFSVQELSIPLVTIESAERTIIVTLSYSLNVLSKSQDTSFRIDTFVSVIPAKLKKMYLLAAELMDAENKNIFLEDGTLEMLSINPKIPLDGMEFTCGQKNWYMNDIQNELKSSIYTIMPRMRFKNTNYTSFLASENVYENLKTITPESLYPKDAFQISADKGSQTIKTNALPKNIPADSYDYFHFFYNYLEHSYPDLHVNVLYQKEWPLYVVGKPNQNGVLQSNVNEGFGNFLRFFCMNLYHFVYDVYYPVEFIIHDDESFNGKGFNFKFASPVVMKNNQADRTLNTIHQFDWPEAKNDFCSDFSSKNVDIRITDAVYFNGLKDVNISYECFNHVCNLGTTKSDGGTYRLVAKLPAGCVNGNIVAEKSLYVKKKEQFIPNSQGVMSLSLIPLKNFTFTVQKQRSNYHLLEPLAPDEKVTVILEDSEYDYQALSQYSVDVSSSLMSSSTRSSTIELLDKDATYKLTILLTKNIGGEDKLVGGFDGNWSVTADSLYGKTNALLKVYEQIPIPTNEQDAVTMFIEIPAASKNLTPTFT